MYKQDVTIGGQWQRWLEPQPLVAKILPLPEVMETITPMITQDTELAPEGGPGGSRLKKPVVPDRYISIEDQDMRHGCTAEVSA
jgi:hypothetical protein